MEGVLVLRLKELQKKKKEILVRGLVVFYCMAVIVGLLWLVLSCHGRRSSVTLVRRQPNVPGLQMYMKLRNKAPTQTQQNGRLLIHHETKGSRKQKATMTTPPHLLPVHKKKTTIESKPRFMTVPKMPPSNKNTKIKNAIVSKKVSPPRKQPQVNNNKNSNKNRWAVFNKNVGKAIPIGVVVVKTKTNTKTPPVSNTALVVQQQPDAMDNNALQLRGSRHAVVVKAKKKKRKQIIRPLELLLKHVGPVVQTTRSNVGPMLNRTATTTRQLGQQGVGLVVQETKKVGPLLHGTAQAIGTQTRKVLKVAQKTGPAAIKATGSQLSAVARQTKTQAARMGPHFNNTVTTILRQTHKVAKETKMQLHDKVGSLFSKGRRVLDTLWYCTIVEELPQSLRKSTVVVKKQWRITRALAVSQAKVQTIRHAMKRTLQKTLCQETKK